MNKNRIVSISVIVFGILFFQACQKETKEILPAVSDSELQERPGHGGDKDGCRLASKISDFGDATYQYNQRGLLDEWFDSYYGGIFKQEYDWKGRLIASRLLVDNAVFYTIKFQYRYGNVVKETWYSGETDEITDEVTYYYDWKGKMKKGVSVPGDYTIDYDYTREGNLWKGLLSFAGKPYYSVEFTYLNRHKNPFSAIPGLVYDYTYAFGIFNDNKWYSTSEKDILYDDLGNPALVVDQDPYKTIVETNRKDYVTLSDFYDNLTQSYNHFEFAFESCGHDHHNDHSRPFSNTFKAKDHNSAPPGYLRFRKGKSKSLKDQAVEFKMQLIDISR